MQFALSILFNYVHSIIHNFSFCLQETKKKIIIEERVQERTRSPQKNIEASQKPLQAKQHNKKHNHKTKTQHQKLIKNPRTELFHIKDPPLRPFTTSKTLLFLSTQTWRIAIIAHLPKVASFFFQPKNLIPKHCTRVGYPSSKLDSLIVFTTRISHFKIPYSSHKFFKYVVTHMQLL